MKINRSRNENLQFAKLPSTFSLRLLRYSKQKIPKKIPFRQQNLDWEECVMLSLPHTKFSGVCLQWTTTGIKAFSLFISLGITKFVLISVITHIVTICPKI